MKLRKLIEWAEKQPRKQTYPEDVIEACGLDTHIFTFPDWLENDTETFGEVDLVTWVCTDTHVGLRVIFFQNQPVALTYKPFRKAKTRWTWIPGKEGQDPRESICQWAMSNLLPDKRLDQYLFLSEKDLEDDFSLTDIIVNDPSEEVFVFNVFDIAEDRDD